jgi:hypothetical protein
MVIDSIPTAVLAPGHGEDPFPRGEASGGCTMLALCLEVA